MIILNLKMFFFGGWGLGGVERFVFYNIVLNLLYFDKKNNFFYEIGYK